MSEPHDTLAHQPAVPGDSSPAPAPLWSIVVIARNEEKAIRASLESLLAAFRDRSHELIFVDSASTDGTVAIVSQFPAQVIRLAPTGPMRPSIGRHVGLQHACGKWILFVDGDSIVNEPWVREVEQTFEAHPDLGGVAGDIDHVVVDEHGHELDRYKQWCPEADYHAAEFLAGCVSAYTRKALVECGGFNPFLRACEEAELGARLRRSGYRMVRLRSWMTRTFEQHAAETPRELLRRIRRGFFVGMGQFGRYCYTQRLPVDKPLASIQRHLQFAVLVALGLLAAGVSLWKRDGTYILAWAGLMLLLFALFALKNRSVRKPAYYFLEWSMTFPLVIWGLLEAPHTIDEFPAPAIETGPVPPRAVS